MRLRLVAVLVGLAILWAPLCGDVPFTVPKYAVPADNAWDYYVAAFELLPPKGEVWNRVERADGEPSAADVEALLRAAAPALTKLRGGLGKPCVPRYQEFGDDTTSMMEAMRDARAMARVLRWEAWLGAKRGDCDGAFISCLDGITLGQDIARNGGTYAKLVSIGCEGLACSRIRRTAAMAAGDGAALARPVSRLQGVESCEVPYADALAHDYGTRIAYLKWLRDSGKMTREMWQQRYGTRSVGAGLILARRELDRRYSEAVALAQRPSWEWSPAPTSESEANATVDALLRALRLLPRDPKAAGLTPRQQERYDRRLAHAKRELLKVFVPEDQTLAETLSPSPRTGEKTVDHLADLRGTLLAAALELHRARAGEYPSALTELVPRVLDSMPLDPWSGEPFRYRRVAPGQYTLYSVGPDRADNGGLQKGWRAADPYDLPFSTAK